jgi:16S rRNA (guanine527-N7)-methyltransferase
VSTLAELSQLASLTPDQTQALDAYVEAILGWRQANVTGLRTREAIVDTLVGDALALLDVPQLREAVGPAAAGGPARFADLGAGAGVPGIPVAVALPGIDVTLIESVGKKCVFLETAVVAAGLAARAHVVCARSEHAVAPGQPLRAAFDIVLARAVGSLATVVELAAPLLAIGGALLVSKTASAARDEGPRGAAAARECGLAARPVVPLSKSPLHSSVCVLYEKIAATPRSLPRRAGLARSSPLGG